MPALKAAAAAGKAYLVVEPHGVIVLDHGKLAHPFAMPHDDDRYVSSVALASNGDLMLETVSKIYRVAHGKVSKASDLPAAMSSVKLVPAPDGSLWAWSITTAAHLTGTTWKLIKGDSLGPSGIVGLAVAKDGTVWLAEQKQLFKWNGKAFDKVAIPAIGDALFTDVAATSDGKVYAATSNGLVEVTATKPAPIKIPDALQTQLVAGPEGRLAVVAFGGGLSVFVPPDQLVTYPKLATSGQDAVAFDGGGRIWVSTETGLVVYDAHGKPTRFPLGSVPQIAGEISSIAVAGAGPALPAVGEIARGRIKGVVSTAGGVAIPGAVVEICASANMMFAAGKSPCAGEPFMKSTKTNKDGEYEFDDVPVGTWSFAVLRKPGAKWVITFRNFCSQMKKGGTCNAPLQLDH